jgi:hypothetical protein
MREELPGRADAIRLVQEDRARTRKLLDQLSAAAFVTSGLGGSTWSPKDLVGHLETWELLALDALDAIRQGEPAPITQQSLDTDELNRREIERRAGRSAEEIRASSSATFERMLEAFRVLSDEDWSAPEGADAERSLGDRLGSILGGSRGFFRHDPDHWDDLEAFAAKARLR